MSLKLTKLLSLILMAVSLVFGLLGLNTKIFALFSGLASVIMLSLVIYFLDKEDFEERFIWPLHGFALHALVFGVTMLLFGVDGALYSRWYHALLDALVAASLLKLMKQNQILLVIISIITGICSLVNLQVAVQVIFCLLALLSVFTVVQDFDEVSDLGYILVLIISVLLEKVFKVGNIEYWYHLMFNLLGLLLAFLMIKSNDSKREVFEVEELDNSQLRTVPIDTREIEVETVDSESVERVNVTHFDRENWINSQFDKLSLEDLYNAPVSALKGVGDIMADKLDKAFQIKTIKDLANNDFFKLALEILKKSQL